MFHLPELPYFNPPILCSFVICGTASLRKCSVHHILVHLRLPYGSYHDVLFICFYPNVNTLYTKNRFCLPICCLCFTRVFVYFRTSVLLMLSYKLEVRIWLYYGLTQSSTSVV